MTERSGIEIDYCPECRGVWLDRGELDKIIERAAPGPAVPVGGAPLAPPTPAATERLAVARPKADHRDWDDDDDDDDDRRHRTALGKRKKKGLLGELFDF